MTAQPRLVVSAPSSGHGKTAIAVGLLAACAARGMSGGRLQGRARTTPTPRTSAWPPAARAATSTRAWSARSASRRCSRTARPASQLAVIEGAMGLFDSLTGQPEIDGTAAVAAALRAPVVLVVDVAAMGHSVAALVHGFRMFDEMVHLGGVILNRVASPRHEQMLRDRAGRHRHAGARRAAPRRPAERAAGPGARAGAGRAPAPSTRGRAVRRLGEAVAGRARPGPAAGAGRLRAGAAGPGLVAGRGGRAGRRTRRNGR